jgi:hypothetical protein
LEHVAAGAASRRLIAERTAELGGPISICPLVPRRNGGTDPPGGNSWAALVPIAAHTNAAAAAPSMIHCSVKLSPRVDPVPVAHAESREQDKKDARTIWHKKNSSRSLTVLPRMGNRGLLARK